MGSEFNQSTGLDEYIRHIEGALMYLREIRRRVGAVTLAELGEDPVMAINTRLAAEHLGQTAKELAAGIVNRQPAANEEKLPAPENALLFEKILDRRYQQQYMRRALYDDSPTIVNILSDTTISIEGKVIVLSRPHLYIFNRLMLSYDGDGTKFFAEQFRVDGMEVGKDLSRTRSILRNFMDALGGVVVQWSIMKKPYKFSNIVFWDRRDTEATAVASVTETTLPPPEIAPEAVEVNEPRDDSPPPVTKRSRVKRLRPEQQLAAVREAERKIRMGWRDEVDIARAVGLEIDIVRAFINHHRAKMGEGTDAPFDPPDTFTRPGEQQYTSRTTEHYPPPFTTWAIQCLRQAMKKRGAQR